MTSFVACAHDFNSWGVSNVLNALAKFKVTDEKLVKALCAAGAGKAFSPIGIAACLNALARLKMYEEVFITQLRTEALVKVVSPSLSFSFH